MHITDPQELSEQTKMAQTGPKRLKVVNTIDLGSSSDNATITSNQTPPEYPVNSVIHQQIIYPTKSGILTNPDLNDRPLLPAVLPSDKGKHTLVLDMDGTLLREYTEMRIHRTVDFVLRHKSTGARTFVSKRPNLDRFLFGMEKFFEIVIFTDSSKKRADVILDTLRSRTCIRHRLYRDSCTEVDGRLVKDLSRLGRHLSKIILIDDCPFASALQPSNAIPVSWFSGNELDGELTCVYKFIRGLNLTTKTDVRIALQQSDFRKRNPNPWETAPKLVGHLLPPMNSCDEAKHTLVLDMDGTLLIELRDKLPNCPPDFTCTTCPPDSISSGASSERHVYKRPGVEDFLAAMEKLFEIVIFTSSPEWRATTVLGHFQNRSCIRFHLSRDSCITLRGRRIKDLSGLGRDLRKVIIIDDQPLFYQLQQFNGIPIKPFDGDSSDRELTDLIPFLRELSEQEDVRPLIQSKYDDEVFAEELTYSF